MDYRDKLLNIAREVFNNGEITLNSTRDEIKEWDSVGYLILITRIEEELSISIPFEDIRKINKIEDFLMYISNKSAG
ncbi:acyl carrier protein [Acetomicrobium sp.]|uniref:acyl carrier protein n=1 Tax=Acetomicrobium sp. TaxID=1872099 RepID=UPI001BD03A55|nr:acyl carrier protein [Acetomicrobium sp.]